MRSSTFINPEPFAVESDFEAMALTEFDTDFDWPLEANHGGLFEAETKADNPVFKQARLQEAPELFGGRGPYQILRSGKVINFFPQRSCR